MTAFGSISSRMRVSRANPFMFMPPGPTLMPSFGLRVAESVGFSRREQAELVRVVEARRNDVMRAWHEHFGDFGSV
jgi:hypothetical protein